MTNLSGRLELSDEQVFQHLASDTDAKMSVPRLAETYDAYKDVRKEHVAWSKQ